MTVAATVQGTAVPSPYGGKVRQIQVDLDPKALQSKGLSANDVTNAAIALRRGERDSDLPSS